MKAALRERINRHVLTPRFRKFVFRTVVSMLSGGHTVFIVFFVTVASAGLVIQMAPWILRTGVTDIDPLPIIIASTVAGFAGAYLRYLILLKFSHITVIQKKPKREKPEKVQEKNEKKDSDKEESSEESSPENPETSN